jgi:bacterioferritin (cytochrome b1)
MASLFARIACPLVWGFPGHKAKVLFGFSLAEYGSMLELSAAARYSPSFKRSALYVRHLSDEIRHADLFAQRSAELRKKLKLDPLGHPHADTENLFQSLGERRFLAFVHRGEARACKQFKVYEDWLRRHGDKKTSNIFKTILQDERRHAEYTLQLLRTIAGSERAARKYLRRAGLWEAKCRWLRISNSLSGKMFFVLAVTVYLLAAPYVVLASRLYPEQRGWVRSKGTTASSLALAAKDSPELSVV